jgi:hypothetical protein
MNVREVECGGMDWIYLDEVAGSCECGNEAFGYIRGGDFLHELRNS